MVEKLPVQAVLANSKSPCIKQCKLSPDKTHCTGCLRTLEEIRNSGLARTKVTTDQPMVGVEER